MTTASGEPPRDKRCCEGSYCHGKKRDGSGEYCHRPQGWGTAHAGYGACKLHGGSADSHMVAAKTEMARQAVATYGLPREVDPAVVLLEEVHRTAGHIAWLSEVVAAMDKDELVWGVVEEIDRTGGQLGSETTSRAAPSIWLELYQKERAHGARVAKDAIAAGIAERQVRLAEQQGAIVVDVIRRILDRLDLTAAQSSLVPSVVPEELRRAAAMN